MLIAEWVAVAQTTGGPAAETSNAPSAGYIALAILAVVLTLVVTIFIRTSMRRSSKSQG